MAVDSIVQLPRSLSNFSNSILFHRIDSAVSCLQTFSLLLSDELLEIQAIEM